MNKLNTEIEKYLSVCQNSKGLSELSLKAYRIDFEQFERYFVGRDYLSKDEITAYIEHLHKRYKPKSAKRKIACIKAFYRYMEMEDIIEYNPFHKIIIKYKEPIVLPRTIPLNYINSILSFAYDHYAQAHSDYQKEVRLRNIVVIELLFSTGMRVSEISKLRIDDINITDGSIRIFGKGSKERIMCITNEHILNILCKYISIRKSSEYVFVNRLGNRLSEQSIRNMINDYSQAAKVPMHITPHMFRHTFATALHDEDIDIQYIQQLLGHSSITTTQIYSHISTNKIRSILENKHPRNNKFRRFELK